MSTAPGEFEHGLAQVGKVRTHYVTIGSGEPIVLLHGWPQTWWEWRRLAAGLADRHRLIIPDLRGLGASSRPAEGYDKRTIAADVWGLLDQLGVGEVTVVGHDLGGAVAYQVAHQRREQIRALVVIEMMMPGFGVEEEFAQRDENGIWHLSFHLARDVTEALVSGRERLYFSWFFNNFSYDRAAITEADLDEYVRAYREPGALRAGFEYYRTLFQDGRDNRAASAEPLPMPALAVGGSHSMGARCADSLRGLAADVTGCVMPESGHYVPEEHPEELAGLITDFLAGRESALTSV